MAAPLTSDKLKGAKPIESPHPAYKIEGPALVSFSGGRTSGYMLHEIIRAHGGKLPDNVHVCFANTGKEREETLRFVHECGSRWGVLVRWLERREGGFEEVGFNSAARNGEPFAALIAKKGFVPNAVTRFCTLELKIRVMRDFARSVGFDHWTSVIGLRYDEGHRVLKALAANDAGKERWKNALPLSKTKVTRQDVEAFWKASPFDLQLAPHEGNCDLCFLKSRNKKLSIIRARPDLAKWWIEQEAAIAPDQTGARFVMDYAVADLAREIRNQGTLFDEPLDVEEFDAECGLQCAGFSEVETI